jgi:hypothetical protein
MLLAAKSVPFSTAFLPTSDARKPHFVLKTSFYLVGHMSLLGFRPTNLVLGLQYLPSILPETLYPFPQIARQHDIQCLSDQQAVGSALVTARGTTFGQTFRKALVPHFESSELKPCATLQYAAVIRDRAVVAEKGFSYKAKYTIS